MRLKHAVYSYLSPADYRRLQQEAVARGASLSRCVADCLREYLALRAEAAGVVAAPGKLGESHQGLIPTLLARTEERLAATLGTHAERTTGLHEDLRRIQSMLDRLAMLYLIHTPELPPDRKDAAVSTAKPRHQKWRSAVEQHLQPTGGNGAGAREEPGAEEG